MLVYYNPNPAGRNVGDCVIRAISKALNLTWEQAYIELCIQGYAMNDLPNSNPVWGAYLQSKGFKRYIIPNDCPNCYTIADFARDNNTGLYIVATGSHVVTVDNGSVYDSWNSLSEFPTYFFKEG